MVAEIARQPAKRLLGHVSPRIAPPEPVRSLVREYEAEAAELRIKLYPWQKVAARYITALREGRQRKGETPRWKYREVAVVVSRQNGKTELLLPRILMGLKRGESIIHTAQNRSLPRKTFLRIAALIAAHPDLDYDIRKTNGQEEIRAPGGGRYFLVAPNASSRGESADLVILDEIREQHDQDVMDAILPTITARPNAQIVYLSNAGDDESIVLNDLRRRGTETDEPELAYLEWSAAPERDLDDREGWAEANPSLGYGLALDTLEYFRANRPPASFETEHLCRWVVTSLPTLVDETAFAACEEAVGEPIRAVLGVSLDPSGTRASAVSAWARADGTIAVRVEREYTGDPIDVVKLQTDYRALATSLRTARVAFSKTTDAQTVTQLPKAQAVDGREFESASQTFAQLVAGRGLRWDDADGVLALDLRWTARKTSEEMRTFHAVRAKDDRPITAALAAIRAVHLVAQQLQSGPARIY